MYFCLQIITCQIQIQLWCYILNFILINTTISFMHHLQLNRSKTLIEPYQAYEDQEDKKSSNQDNGVFQKNTQKRENVHQFILSEFKQKYDQLKNQFELKKKEADSLLYDKKKLEIELLNHNVEYYEKQIIRLRTEAEKHQLQNVQVKHKYLVAQNNKNDIVAAAKVKQEEFKKILKQLQNEKILVVQLKHQLGLKDKQFTSVISDVEKINQDISLKYQKTNNLLNNAQNDLKAKKGEIQVMKKCIQNHEKDLQQKQKLYNQQVEKRQLNEYRYKNRITDLQEQVQTINRKQNQKIKQLQRKVKQLQDEKISQAYFLVQKNQSADFAKRIRSMEHQIAIFEQKTRQNEIVIHQKQKTIEALQMKLKNVCSINLLDQSQQRYNQIIQKHQYNQRILQNHISDLQKELEHQKLRNKSSPGSYYQYDPKSKVNFQELLKNQIQENNKLKVQLSYKIDQIFALKNTIEEQNIKESLLQNEIDILKKKQKAEEKNSKINFQIEIQNLRNEIDSLKRKLEVTEHKFNIKAKEAKDKDSFITNIIISRSRQEDVPYVVAQLKRIFQAEYIDKLNEANLKILDLQKKHINQ